MTRLFLNDFTIQTFNMNKQQILELIKSRRKVMGLSQKEMAHKLEVTQAQYGRYELGTSQVSLDKLLQIGKILDLDVYMTMRATNKKPNDKKADSLVQNLLECIEIAKSMK